MTRQERQLQQTTHFITSPLGYMILFVPWEIFHAFCHPLIFFNINFLENSFKNTIRVSNSLDPDQVRHFVGPDMGPNCLQRLSADGTRR